MKRFEMTPEQLQRLYAASEPVMCIIGTWPSPPPPSPQDRANRFWQMLGDELGFVWDTARPIAGEPDSVFEAEERVSVQKSLYTRCGSRRAAIPSTRSTSPLPRSRSRLFGRISHSV